MQDVGIQRETSVNVMLLAVFVGRGLQVLIGRLSDQLDWRIMLSMRSLGFATPIAAVSSPKASSAVFPAATLLGGFMSRHDHPHGFVENDAAALLRRLHLKEPNG